MMPSGGHQGSSFGHSSCLAYWSLVIHNLIRCTVLCASDPYAVVGVTKGFGFEPDLVSGVATSTSAGVEVIRRLAHRPALNLLDVSSHQELDRLLKDRLGL